MRALLNANLPSSLVIDGVRYVRAGTQSELWSAAQIAAHLGLNVGHVRDRLVHRPDFPAPAIESRRARRWRREAIERWVAEQERQSQRGRLALGRRAGAQEPAGPRYVREMTMTDNVVPIAR